MRQTWQPARQVRENERGKVRQRETGHRERKRETDQRERQVTEREGEVKEKQKYQDETDR